VITAPGVSRVLCYGDSNTHGAPADDPDYVRLPADRRWTGVLQGLLGPGFDVVEEGLSGRTTDRDYDDRPGCNGRHYFVPCLQSHQPLDVVVVMLGTNDLKSCFDRTAQEIATSLAGYVDDISANVTDRHARVPATVLVSPIWIDDTAPWYGPWTSAAFDTRGVRRSREVGGEISRVASARGVLYADAAQVARAGGDGLHLSLDSHAPLAELIGTKVLQAVSGSADAAT
jgi:lysophospholipase L1-like esterase